MARLLCPDLILLDLSMPVMNGIEAACELKRLMPMVPIIVFSEYSEVFSEPEARKFRHFCARLENGGRFSATG